MKTELQGGMTPTEWTIAQIWASELGTAEPVQADTDFFQLGGDSLLMLNMLFRVSQQLGVEVQPPVLYENSTLSKFCDRVDHEINRQGRSLVEGAV